MGIYTSRYSNKELADGKYYCVGISIGTPKFKLAYRLENQCYSLAPKGYMLRMNLEDFKKAYYEKLNGIGKDRIISMVMKMERDAAEQGKDLVLLCYEDVRIPEDWCIWDFKDASHITLHLVRYEGPTHHVSAR